MTWIDIARFIVLSTLAAMAWIILSEFVIAFIDDLRDYLRMRRKGKEE